EVVRYLVDTHGADESTANEVALIADGNIHTAVTLIEQRSDNSSFDVLIRWLRTIVTTNDLEMMSICEEELATWGRKNRNSILLFPKKIMRQVIVMRQGLKDLVFLQEEERAFVEKFSTLFSFEQLTEASGLLA